MNKSLVFTLSLLFVAFIALPIIGKAQSTDSSSDPSIPAQINDVQEQIDSTVDPTTPSPGQAVTITLEAYGTDLERANITWTQNGVQKLSGQGQKQFSFTASQIGGADNIVATIVPYNGPAVTKTFNISPGEVDLLWEANTYTPPFYKGKALFSPESDVTFVAIPNMIAKGSRVASSKAVYTWKIDYQAQADKSGLGVNTFSYTGPVILGPHTFEVDAYSSADPNVTGVSEQTIDETSPSINLYENHPLYGILFNKSLLGTFNMNDSEKKISAYPYFFSTADKNANLTYLWTVNESNVDVPQTQNEMSFIRTAKDSGSATMSVKVDSTTNFLQEAFGNLSLYFNDGNNVFVNQ